MFDLAMNTGQE